LQTLEELKKKRTEVNKIDESSLPPRPNLMKYITPIVTEGLAEVSKIRKKNAVELLTDYFLTHADDKAEGDLELDDEFVSEFRKILKWK
jgi:hypothetical protein